MIEVEKRFQPTDEQLKALLLGAEFLGEVALHDIYYDYPDYRLHKKGVILRKRNENFEIKIQMSNVSKKEIEDEEEIKKYFSTDMPLQDFVEQNMSIVTDYVNNRKKYKKDNFTVDIDNMDFGVKFCEIELMVSNEEEVKDAEVKIKDFANKYSFEFKKLLSKRGEYLKRFKPEIFKELFKEK